jgi:peptidoglycan/xylan/chitin deacetylase (PgdA/CDA1 family)/Flp pilus assembly protein TadD
VLAFILLAGFGRFAWSQTGPEAELDRILDLYRSILVVLDEAETRGESQREALSSAARQMYHEKEELLRDLEARIGSEGEVVAALGDVLGRDDLDPSDRLAFAELIEAAVEIDRGRGGDAIGAVLRWNDELTRTRQALDEEVAPSRGAGARARWKRYVAGIRRAIDLDVVLRDFPLTPEPGSRGGSPYGENAVFGYQLPKKQLVLTFDDGPHSRHTDAILRILENYGVSAYFFAVGRNLGNVAANGAVTWTRASTSSRLAHEAGHFLANHSFSHRQMPKLDHGEREEEVVLTNRLIEEISGARSSFFRPPYGDTTRELADELARSGMTSVLWNIDSWDWGDPVPESIVGRVLERVEKADRGILLFHDVHKQTVAALPGILEGLAARGYTFATLEGAPARAPKAVTLLDRNRSPGFGADERSRRPEYYRTSFALIIGVNDYQSWPRLEYAVNDATAIESALVEQFGFPRENVIRLLDRDATRDRIVEALGGTLADPGHVGPDDRVLVFFAGHGATRKLPSGKELGYIIPVDAALPNYPVRSISMTELKDFSELIPAKHVYFIMDSCYSGLALTRGGGGSYLEEVTERRARQILTAGGADEIVADHGPSGHSIFTWTLLQGLQGLADLDGNGVLTATEVGAFTAPIVSKFSSQTPAFGNLEGSEGGEFLFPLELENLSEMSRALDQEAVSMSAELESLQRELTSKLERNLELREQVEELRASGEVELSHEERLAQANRHHALGLQYFREERPELALREMEEAVRLNPANPTIVNNYGFVLYRLGRYQDSLEWFEKTIALDPGRAVVYLNLADALWKLGREEEARPRYRRYLELWPSTPRRDEIERLIGNVPP